jgi:hypothetical protein
MVLTVVPSYKREFTGQHPIYCSTKVRIRLLKGCLCDPDNWRLWLCLSPPASCFRQLAAQKDRRTAGPFRVWGWDNGIWLMAPVAEQKLEDGRAMIKLCPGD